MKILILNNNSSRYTLADAYLYAFQQLGLEAHLLNLFFSHARESLAIRNRKKKSYELFLERSTKKVLQNIWSLKKESQHRIILSIQDLKPDLIVVMGNLEIGQDIFSKIRSNVKSCKVFCYLADPLPTTNNLILNSIPAYDCIFTFSKFQIPLIYWFGGKKVVFLPFAYDPRFHKKIIISDQEADFYGSEVAYLGTWQPHIEFWVNELTSDYLKIWGNQWHKLKGYAQLKEHWQGEGVGLYEDLAKVVNSTKVIFNAVRYHNGNGHSMKTFEIPACGGFMLSNRTEEQLDFFPEDKCAAYFSTKEELKDKLKYYLRNDSARNEIARAGYEIAQQYPYSERAKQILLHFKQS